MSHFVNLTPHAIKLRLESGDFFVPASGQVARVAVVSASRGLLEINGETAEFGSIPVVTNEYGEVEGLPEPKYETVYIVSALVLGRVSGRRDVYAPDTGSTAVRAANGQIEAVTRLVSAE